MSKFEDIIGIEAQLCHDKGTELKYITDFEEFYHDKGAICPYCGYLNERDGTEEEFYVDGEYTYQCEHCNKEFILTTSISYNYYTSKLDEVDNEN